MRERLKARPGGGCFPPVAGFLRRTGSRAVAGTLLAAPLAAQTEGEADLPPGTPPRLPAVRIEGGSNPTGWRPPAVWRGAVAASGFIQAESCKLSQQLDARRWRDGLGG